MKSRRVAARFLAFAALLLVLPLAGAATTDLGTPGGSLKGQLLIAAPEVAKNPIPTASRTNTALFIRITRWANGVATATAISATVMLGQCSIEYGGRSSSRSRRMPPPRAVSTPIVAIPNRSKPLRTPTVAPDDANTAMPT